MGEMIETVGREVTSDVMRAREVHADIMASKKQVAIGIYELAHGLKVMRDEELFRELGYEDFKGYCESMAKVNVSQAYKYIKAYEELGAGALQSAGGMGIEKLFLVTQLPPAERSDALAEPEKIEGMSVKELREFVARARQWGDQLTFLEHEIEAVEDDRREAEDKLAEVTKRLAEAEEESRRKLKDQHDAMSDEIEALKVRQAQRISEMKIEHAKACAAIATEQSEKRATGHAADDEIRAAHEEGRKAGRLEGEEELERQKKAFEELQRKISEAKPQNDPTREQDIQNTFEFFIDQMLLAYANFRGALFGNLSGYDLTQVERRIWINEIFKNMHNFMRDISKQNSETEVTKEDIEEYRRRAEKKGESR